MARPRKPTKRDLESMSEAVGLVMSYEVGSEGGSYEDFAVLSRDYDGEDAVRIIRALASLGWMLTKNLESKTGHSRERILSNYGMLFARGQDEGWDDDTRS